MTFDTGRLHGLTPTLLSDLALLSGLAEESPKTSPRDVTRKDGDAGVTGEKVKVEKGKGEKEGTSEQKEEEKQREAEHLLEKALDDDIAKEIEAEQRLAG